MLWYSIILVALTVLPWAFGVLGVIYVASALALGGVFLFGVLRVARAAAFSAPAWWLYAYSLLYLALLFAAMVVDRGLAS
jgi:protoheme IX farnesyltransferase